MSRGARLILFTGQSLDAVSFALVVALAPALFLSEQNPLVVALYGLGGSLGVMAVKIGMTGGVCWWSAGHSVRSLARNLMHLAAAMGFVGFAFNLFALGSVLALGK